MKPPGFHIEIDVDRETLAPLYMTVRAVHVARDDFDSTVLPIVRSVFADVPVEVRGDADVREYRPLGTSGWRPL